MRSVNLLVAEWILGYFHEFLLKKIEPPPSPLPHLSKRCTKNMGRYSAEPKICDD
jgi:hypothetical protein